MKRLTAIVALITVWLTGCSTAPAMRESTVIDSAVAVAPVVESCGAFSPAADDLLVLPLLRVGQLADDETFSLPSNAPADTEFIHCERDSLIPMPSDYKVLAAGHPLVIASGDRVAVLEASEARVNFRTLEGEFTEEEIPVIRDYLNWAQRLLDTVDAASQFVQGDAASRHPLTQALGGMERSK